MTLKVTGPDRVHLELATEDGLERGHVAVAGLLVVALGDHGPGRLAVRRHQDVGERPRRRSDGVVPGTTPVGGLKAMVGNDWAKTGVSAGVAVKRSRRWGRGRSGR